MSIQITTTRRRYDPVSRRWRPWRPKPTCAECQYQDRVGALCACGGEWLDSGEISHTPKETADV